MRKEEKKREKDERDYAVWEARMYAGMMSSEIRFVGQNGVGG